jgi:hypothetical protein
MKKSKVILTTAVFALAAAAGACASKSTITDPPVYGFLPSNPIYCREIISCTRVKREELYSMPCNVITTDKVFYMDPLCTVVIPAYTKVIL